MYKRTKYTKTSFDGRTEEIEVEEKNSSGLLEFCTAIMTITLSILTATLILQNFNHASSIRRLDKPINQPEKAMPENTRLHN
ncbi:hypothetical protein NSMS1_64760 (plasmid) [Nostoc sp. MS1]|nr:hypothetical protein NSMS1_64760 [Nostoc sp. MS1]